MLIDILTEPERGRQRRGRPSSDTDEMDTESHPIAPVGSKGHDHRSATPPEARQTKNHVGTSVHHALFLYFICFFLLFTNKQRLKSTERQSYFK